jgi:hypothetical protein
MRFVNYKSRISNMERAMREELRDIAVSRCGRRFIFPNEDGFAIARRAELVDDTGRVNPVVMDYLVKGRIKGYETWRGWNYALVNMDLEWKHLDAVGRR